MPFNRKKYQEEHKEERKVYMKKYCEDNKEILKEKRKIYNDTLQRRFKIYKRNARVRGLEFNLTIENFDRLTSNQKCRYCKVFYELLGIDRFDNTVPYYHWNVVPCCRMCNEMKLDYTYKDFIKQCGKIYENNIKKLIIIK